MPLLCVSCSFVPCEGPWSREAWEAVYFLLNCSGFSCCKFAPTKVWWWGQDVFVSAFKTTIVESVLIKQASTHTHTPTHPHTHPHIHQRASVRASQLLVISPGGTWHLASVFFVYFMRAANHDQCYSKTTHCLLTIRTWKGPWKDDNGMQYSECHARLAQSPYRPKLFFLPIGPSP